MTTTEKETQLGSALTSYKREAIERYELDWSIDNVAHLLEITEEAQGTVESRQPKVLARARFIFATLGFSFSKTLREVANFGMVIVARSNTACESITGIPLLHSPPRVVLIGDEQQIAPRVSEAGEWLDNHRSMFELLLDSGHPSVLLEEQDHCHPSIYKQPSNTMYDGQVVTAVETGKALKLFEWQFETPVWYPSTYVDVRGDEQKIGT